MVNVIMIISDKRPFEALDYRTYGRSSVPLGNDVSNIKFGESYNEFNRFRMEFFFRE
jgi:hypothetical protein